MKSALEPALEPAASPAFHGRPGTVDLPERGLALRPVNPDVG